MLLQLLEENYTNKIFSDVTSIWVSQKNNSVFIEIKVYHNNTNFDHATNSAYFI